jgi:hypothetical protein
LWKCSHKRVMIICTRASAHVVAAGSGRPRDLIHRSVRAPRCRHRPERSPRSNAADSPLVRLRAAEKMTSTLAKAAKNCGRKLDDLEDAARADRGQHPAAECPRYSAWPRVASVAHNEPLAAMKWPFWAGICRGGTVATRKVKVVRVDAQVRRPHGSPGTGTSVMCTRRKPRAGGPVTQAEGV